MADGLIFVDGVCGLPEALATKQDTLVIDSSPVHGSTNVATSGGVYDFVVESMQQLSSSVDNSLCETTGSVAGQLSGKADVVHRHTIDDVDGLQDKLTSVTVRVNAVSEKVCGISDALATKQDTLVIDSSPVHGSANVVKSGGVYAFVEDAMQQLSSSVCDTLSEVTGSVAGQLSGKADVVHRHKIGDVDSLQDALSSKADAVHQHTIVDVDGLQDELICVTARINAVSEKVDASDTSYDLVTLRNSLLTPVNEIPSRDIYDGGRFIIGWYGTLYSLGVRSSCVDLRTITLAKGCGSTCNEPPEAYVMVSTYVDDKLTLLYRSTVPVDWSSTCGGCNVTFHLEPSTSRRLSSQDNIYIAITDCGCGDVHAVSGSFTLANSSSNPGAAVNNWTDGWGAPCVICDYAPYVWATYSDVSYSNSLEGRMEHNISVLRNELQSVIVDTRSIVSSLCDTITSKQNALRAGNNIVISSDTISIDTPDTTPKDGSTKLVTSGGVKRYVDRITGCILTALDEL